MQRKSFIYAVAILLMLVFTGGIFLSVQADVIGDSESRHQIRDSQGRVKTTIIMERGEITIIATATTATTSIRWRTVGFTISRNPLNQMNYTYRAEDGNYPLNGYQDISTIYQGGTGVLYFNNAVDKRSVSDPASGTTTTTYKFSASQVENVLKGDKFNTITKNTPIYLHAIFETYQIQNGREVLRKSNIVNWKDIVLAEYWNRNTGQLEEFRQYFNMPIEFQPAPQENTIHYYNDGNQKIKASAPLDSLLPGETVTWKNQPANLTDKNVEYELYKYVVTQKGKGIGSPISNGTHYLGDSDGCTLAKIQNGSAKVLVGGMDVYLYYRQNPGVKIVLRAVDYDTGAVIKDKLYEGTVVKGKSFSQAVDTALTHQGVTYSKMLSHFYTYMDSKNQSQDSYFKLKQTTDPIAFSVPSDVKIGSTIVVTVYYEKAAAGTIPVRVVAVNKKTGVTLQSLTTGSVAPGADYSYTTGESLNSGGKNYSFSGEWKWSYKGKSSSSPTISASGNGTKVNFKAPRADQISGEISVEIYYTEGEGNGTDILLRVLMVSESGGLIQKFSSEKVTRNQVIRIGIPQEFSSNGIAYTYTNRWDYTYQRTGGSQGGNGSGANVSFTVPNTTTLGTTVVVKIYYRGLQEVEIPEAGDPIYLSIDTPDPYGVIDGDRYSARYFNSEEGIPTTESQHAYVKTKDYLLGYHIVNRTGKIDLYVPVTMNYTLRYFSATPDSAGGPKPVEEVVSDTQIIKVERAFSYWEIINFEYYIINNATLYNYSLPGGSVMLNANHSLIPVPSLSTSHSTDMRDHILPPKQVTEGILLNHKTVLTSETSDRPVIEYEDLTAYALTMTEEVMVRNDFLSFDGSTVLSDAPREKIADWPNPYPLRQSNQIIPDKALYKEGLVVDAVKTNGEYLSTGSVYYSPHHASVGVGYSGKTFRAAINPVTIHTPVICEPVISENNNAWVQLLKPEEDAVQIVLDPDSELNDFTVRISNTLEHSDRLGYRSRDFSRSFIDPVNTSYIAMKEGVVRNEMKLPFDVYHDTYQDKNPENDKFIPAGTWIVLGRTASRFYVPMWVKEGVYEAQFRTVAVNGEDKLTRTETTRNANGKNYVATATRKIQVSGRIYGFTLYDLYDYPTWENVFREKDTMYFKYFRGAADGTISSKFDSKKSYTYTVGTKDRYGNPTGRLSKFTVPLVNGSHPQYNNIGVIKQGYAVRFLLETTGDMYSSANSIKIVPTFYYVDKNGKNRQQVDLYYEEEIQGKHHYVVRVGDGLDLVNVKRGTTGNIYSRIPEEELKHTAAVMGTTYKKLYQQNAIMYTYSEIRMYHQFRTFAGTDYSSFICSLPSYKEVKEATGETELSLSKYQQKWYGTYKLPVRVYAAPAGYDVKGRMKIKGIDYREDFWLTGGYIIVNFNIITIDKNGKQNLSYINGANYLNQGQCSMWVTEGGAVSKTDHKKATFTLRAGDVLFYDTDKSYYDDFEGVLN